jgi:hypothetical protein
MDMNILDLKPNSPADMDIIIPSCRDLYDLNDLCAEIRKTATEPYRLIIAANPGRSASQNRNICLNRSEANFVIMLDDDITGLHPFWNKQLIQELADPAIKLVSARLMKLPFPGQPAFPASMMSSRYIINTPFEIVKKVPTACVAFRKTIIRFDENFKGSGFEDDVFCLDMGPVIIIDNKVKVIHLNEMKQQSDNWEFNKNYFEEKYAHRLI